MTQVTLLSSSLFLLFLKLFLLQLSCSWFLSWQFLLSSFPSQDSPLSSRVVRLQLRGQEHLLAEDTVSRVSFLSVLLLLSVLFLLFLVVVSLSSQLHSQSPWLELDSLFLWN